jgi:hypothetical protein
MLGFRFRVLAVSYVLVILVIVAMVLVAARGIGGILHDAETHCGERAHACDDRP